MDFLGRCPLVAKTEIPTIPIDDRGAEDRAINVG
jgi:hypothetical protein